LIGSLPLTAGYWMGGILTTELVPAGLLGSVMAMGGVVLGKHYRSRISEKHFVLVIDIILGLMAVNLLRKSLGF